MLSLNLLQITQFKNYSNCSFTFPERVTGICGKNGVGKTNLLDAIYYLCFTKSYFTRTDSGNVSFGSSGFRLEGNFLLNSKSENAICVLRENGKKEFSVNDNAYDKFSHHIGRYPCVVIAPDDAELITGDSKERRGFTDALLCQMDTEYLKHLIEYKKVLEQRNSMLKSFAETGKYNEALMDVLDLQLQKPAEFVFTKRKIFLDSFFPVVKDMYCSIAGRNEDIGLSYESDLLSTPVAELLHITRKKDKLAQRTTCGIHKDDINLLLGGKPFKVTASQGQRKSLLFALKLAEMEVLKNEKGFPPILLLDDVFEKLDEERIGNLLSKVCVENLGQVFITDTNEDRLTFQLQNISTGFQIINL